MSETVVVRIEPAGARIELARGAPLLDTLVRHGCETPCGGLGLCGGCRVRVDLGDQPITSNDRDALTPAELDEGWRLGCAAHADTDVTLTIWGESATVLGDAAVVAAGAHGGLGVAVDLGTTTLAAQLVEMGAGALVASETALNAQTRFGADVMSRVRAALEDDRPTRLIRAQIGEMIKTLAHGREDEIVDIVIVGNTVMHHIFAGLSVAPLASVPFRSPTMGEQRFAPADLGWVGFAPAARVRLPPCLGGFVGSDILAGLVAVGFGEQDGLRALMDLGTNGEIALGDGRRILVASTAAGTAFEAGSIAMGMRASAGAVSQVAIGPGGGFECTVIGGGEPRGLCGSGVVAAVAAGLRTGAILPSGRFSDRSKKLTVAGPVHLTQTDVRELQLAKGAIAAGLRILRRIWGAGFEAIETLHLAGAFGNYVDPEAAVRIGLIEVAADRIAPGGNTALRGAKALLGRESYPLLDLVTHVSLAEDPAFTDTFTACMSFPAHD